MWELQRQPAHDPAAAWEFVEEYSSATEAGERLEFKRTNGWDRYVNRFRVIRVDRVETITVEEW